MYLHSRIVSTKHSPQRRPAVKALRSASRHERRSLLSRCRGVVRRLARKVAKPQTADKPITLADALNAVEAELRREVIMRDIEYTVVALWIAHTYVFHAFIFTPRLFITSIRPDCGKSTLMRIITGLSHKAAKHDNVSAAALRRAGRKDPIHAPTILLDQLDQELQSDDAAIINALCSGAEKGAGSLLVDKDTMKNEVTNYFYPVALGKIGMIGNDALTSRCITIFMRPATEEEWTKLYLEGKQAADENVKVMLETALKDLGPKLQALRPDVPKGFRNRLWDKWRPLVAIAEEAGGSWPKRIRDAMTAMESESNYQGTAAVIVALKEALYAARRPDGKGVVFVAELINEPSRKQPYRLLKQVGLTKAASVRRGERVGDGWKLADLEDAEKRFL